MNQNKIINKTSKSVSELVDTIGKKSDCRMVLSGSCFEVAGSHAILKNLKCVNENKSLKENNNNTITR